jgi:ribosomal protein L9
MFENVAMEHPVAGIVGDKRDFHSLPGRHQHGVLPFAVSVGAADIVAAAASKSLVVERSQVRLPEGPLRQVGEYEIEIKLHADVSANLTVNVVAA